MPIDYANKEAVENLVKNLKEKRFKVYPDVMKIHYLSDMPRDADTSTIYTFQLDSNSKRYTDDTFLVKGMRLQEHFSAVKVDIPEHYKIVRFTNEQDEHTTSTFIEFPEEEVENLTGNRRFVYKNTGKFYDFVFEVSAWKSGESSRHIIIHDQIYNQKTDFERYITDKEFTEIKRYEFYQVRMYNSGNIYGTLYQYQEKIVPASKKWFVITDTVQHTSDLYDDIGLTTNARTNKVIAGDSASGNIFSVNSGNARKPVSVDADGYFYDDLKNELEFTATKDGAYQRYEFFVERNTEYKLEYDTSSTKQQPLVTISISDYSTRETIVEKSTSKSISFKMKNNSNIRVDFIGETAGETYCARYVKLYEYGSPYYYYFVPSIKDIYYKWLLKLKTYTQGDNITISDDGVISAEVPTKTSELENDSNFITEEDIPTIPTKVSELENDSEFITIDDIPEQYVFERIFTCNNGYQKIFSIPDFNKLEAPFYNILNIKGRILETGYSKGSVENIDLYFDFYVQGESPYMQIYGEMQNHSFVDILMYQNGTSADVYIKSTGNSFNTAQLMFDYKFSNENLKEIILIEESSSVSEQAEPDGTIMSYTLQECIDGKMVSLIPSEVTEDTVSGWGFTKNTGTYSKPSTGIPKTDLASAVQTSLNNADSSYARSKIISATCSSEATAQQKVVTLPTNTTLANEDMLVISFTNTNTFSSTADNKITFKIGNDVYTPAYARDGSYSTGTNTTMYGIANRDVYYFVDVTNKKLFFAGHSWDNNTTYSNFVKSGSTAKAGLVPAPPTTAGTTKYLREDGTWVVPPDTTYSSKAGASGGTDTSLVTTGEKYTWNNKQDKVAKLGSTSKPVYVSANGTFAEANTYAGGTAITLNGTSKASSTASLYAPTSVGTKGQVLQSNGSGAPTWVDSTMTKAGLLDLIYPIGSIYMSEKDVSPQTFLGGTWERIKDTFLIAKGDTYTSAGGSATKTIGSANLPKHTHGYTNTTYTISATTLQGRQSGVRYHRHSYSPHYCDNVADGDSRTVSDYGHILTSGGTKSSALTLYTGYSGAQSTQTTESAYNSHTHTLTGTNNSNTSGDGGFNNTALNIMPPYLPVYMWKRTA